MNINYILSKKHIYAETYIPISKKHTYKEHLAWVNCVKNM